MIKTALKYMVVYIYVLFEIEMIVYEFSFLYKQKITENCFISHWIFIQTKIFIDFPKQIVINRVLRHQYLKPFFFLFIFLNKNCNTVVKRIILRIKTSIFIHIYKMNNVGSQTEKILRVCSSAACFWWSSEAVIKTFLRSHAKISRLLAHVQD